MSVHLGSAFLPIREIAISSLCIAIVRIAQLISLVMQHHGYPTWDVAFVDLNSIYVGIFVAVPCVIYILQAISSLLFCERVAVRFPGRDGCYIHLAALSVASTCICSVVMSVMTLLIMMPACNGIEIMRNVASLVFASGCMQAVFFSTCSCLFLAAYAVSDSGVLASIPVLVYAAIDMIVAGIPQLANSFPAIGWSIVQVTNQYELLPIVARGVVPLLLAILSCSIGVLVYRRRDILKKDRQ